MKCKCIYIYWKNKEAHQDKQFNFTQFSMPHFQGVKDLSFIVLILFIVCSHLSLLLFERSLRKLCRLTRVVDRVIRMFAFAATYDSSVLVTACSTCTIEYVPEACASIRSICIDFFPGGGTYEGLINDDIISDVAVLSINLFHVRRKNEEQIKGTFMGSRMSVIQKLK